MSFTAPQPTPAGMPVPGPSTPPAPGTDPNENEWVLTVTPGPTAPPKRRDREMFSVATGLIREYTDKLGRLVTNMLTARSRQQPHEPLMPTALARFTEEFDRLERPLRRLINLGSAIHEEGRVTDLQKLELDLRLTEIEAKFETARVLFAALRPMLPKTK